MEWSSAARRVNLLRATGNGKERMKGEAGRLEAKIRVDKQVGFG